MTDLDTNSRKTVTIELEHAHQRVYIDGIEKDHITETILRSNNFYEWQLLYALRDYVAPHSTVIDVGANIGNHSLFFAVVCDARVIAYEPLSFVADILQKNIEQNSLDETIELRRTAVGDRSGFAAVKSSHANNVGATALSQLPSNGPIPLTTLDLDSTGETISLIKVDAEGMDVAVLRGAIGVITRDRPTLVCEAGDDNALKELSEFAILVGYTFAGKYNATPTYILVPYTSQNERIIREERTSTAIAQHDLSIRDLRYHIGLTRNLVQKLENAQMRLAESNPMPKSQELEARIVALEKLLLKKPASPE